MAPQSQLPENELEKIQRLRQVMDRFGLKQKQMANLLGLRESNLSSILNLRENRKLPNGISYVLETELGVNRAWFDGNEGNMVAEDRVDYIKATRKLGKLPSKAENNQRVQEFISKHLPETKKLPKENLHWVPIGARAGFLLGYEDVVYLDGMYRTSFPMIVGDCYAFEVEGESMLPDYEQHSYFVGQPIESFVFLQPGKDYVFQTVDGLILKRFDKMDDKHIFVHSINEQYNPVPPLPLKEVKKIYARKAKIEF